MLDGLRFWTENVSASLERKGREYIVVTPFIWDTPQSLWFFILTDIFFEEKTQKESEKGKFYTRVSDFTHQQSQMHLKYWLS